jgi:tetratricopeptide (TPR) repeat protein
VEREKHDKICDLVIEFFRIKKKFRQEFDRYRKSGKFNFRSLDELEKALYYLKNETHAVFRYGAEETLHREHLFDLIIGSIFHEVLHLKEYIYTLESYEPRYKLFAEKQGRMRIDGRKDAFLQHSKEILKEAKENLPKKASEVTNLFEDALSLIEGVLKKYRASRRLIRVLYLERELLESIYGEKGLEKVYGIMYKGGPMEGYFRVGASFLKNGFYELAVKTFEEALNKGCGNAHERELRLEIKRRCQLLQKKRPGMAEKILARIG